MASLPVGTAVKLQGLANADYNGKKGIIAVTASDLAERGRVAVIVDGKTLSFKRAKVRRHYPSDDSDESDEAPGSDSDGEAAPPPKRAKSQGKSATGGVFALSILTGWSNIETSTIVGVYATWAEVISKAKEILEKGNGMACDFWLPEEKGGFRYVEEEEEDYDDEYYQDKTDTAREPTGDQTVELATAQHCEGAKGNMILVAQRLTGVALA